MVVRFKRVPKAPFASIWCYGHAADLKIGPKYPDSKWETKCILIASQTGKVRAGITDPQNGLSWKGT